MAPRDFDRNRAAMRRPRAAARWRRIGCALFALTAAARAAGAPADPVPTVTLRKTELNTLRLLRQPAPKDSLAPADESHPFEFTINAGLAFERDAGGDRTWTSPFLLSATRGQWYYEISGDGVARADRGGDRQRGLADVSLVVNRTTLWDDKRFALAPELEVVLPSHGEVGSRGSTQIGRLAFTFDRKIWALSLNASIARDSEVAAGESRYTRGVSAKLIFVSASDPDQALTLQVKRALPRAGDGGATVVRAVVDLPLPSGFALPGCSKSLGSAELSQRLTVPNGSRAAVSISCVL